MSSDAESTFIEPNWHDLLTGRCTDRKKVPRLPVGEDLCAALREWLAGFAGKNATWNGTRFLKWAIAGREIEMLQFLDKSRNAIDLAVAKEIRWMSTVDACGWSQANGMTVMAHYGWIGKALGNNTWRSTTGRSRHKGLALAAFNRRYSEQ